MMKKSVPREKDKESVKNTLRSLLVSAKNGLTPSDLRRDYETMVGNAVPIKELGYPSFFELLQSMPDAIAMHKSRGGTLILSAVASESCRHVVDLVARQKTVKPYCAIKSGMRAPVMSKKMHPPLPVRSKRLVVPDHVKLKLKHLMISYPNGLPMVKFQEAFNKRFGYYLHPSVWGFTTVLDALQSLPDIIKLKPGNSVDGDYVIYSVKASSKGSSGSKKSECSLTSLEGSSSSDKVATSTPATLKKPKVDHVPIELIKQIQEILESSKSGTRASDIPTKYKSYFNEDLPWKSLGYTSVVEMLLDMPDVVELEKPISNGEYLVFAKGQNISSPVTAATDSKEKSSSLPHQLSSLVLKILTGKSVTVKDFPDIFQKATCKELPLENYGFNTVEEFLNCIPEISIFNDEERKQKLIKVSEPTKEAHTDDNNEKTTAARSTEPKKIVSNPEPSFSYCTLSIPTGSKSFGVFVTYVKTPSYLCVQIIGVNTTQALDSLHEDMAQFYNGISGDKLGISNPTIGKPCCARFNNDGYWYRASIVECSELDIVKIKYVDYGNTDIVPLNAIRQPKPHYLALPAQSVECRLANIVPPGSTWPKRACKILVEMTKDKALYAFVTCTKGAVVSLCLCDTTTDKDIHINDYLINEGLACMSSDIGEEHLDTYEMERPPVELSSEEKEVRLPNTVSSVESAFNQFHPLPNPNTSSQQQMYQLMSLMQQNYLMQQSSLPRPFYYPSIVPPPSHPGTASYPMNMTVPAPPGFEKFSSSPQANFYSNGVMPMPPLLATAPPPVHSSAFSLTPVSTVQPPLATVPPLQHIPPLTTVSQVETVATKVSTKLKENVPPLTNGSNEVVPEVKKVIEKKVLLKKVSLPKPYSLHLINHNEIPCAVSNEISSWFWEFDLLSYKLNKMPNPPCAQLIYRDKVPELSQLLVDSQCPVLWEALVKETILVYSVEVLPEIVQSLKCQESLYTALKGVLEEWKVKGSNFWIVRDVAAEKENDLVTRIKKLQNERTSLLASLTEKSSSHDSSISNDEKFSRFVSIDKEVESLKKSLAELKLKSKHNEEEDDDNSSDNQSDAGDVHSILS